MHVELLETIDDESARSIPRWHDILKEVYRFDRTPKLQDFVDVHATTIRRVGIADYHYHNLCQIYSPDKTPTKAHTTSWAEAEMESIISTLYSSLDSLAQEVNLAYKFGIDEGKVHIYHNMKPHAHCVRCDLNKQNDSLANYLNGELSSDWFDMFRKLRNRLTHRLLLPSNTNFEIGNPTSYIEIPPDPAATRFTIKPRQGIEINTYCVKSRQNVVSVINNTYDMLTTKIKDI